MKARILPELDDAWVDENTEFETVEELKVELEERLARPRGSPSHASTPTRH